jgi:hypothetical protein
VLTFRWEHSTEYTPGMDDAQKFYNMLERIEFLLEAIRLELEVARIDRGEVLAPGTDRVDAMRELQAALRVLDGKRQDPF